MEKDEHPLDRAYRELEESIKRKYDFRASLRPVGPHAKKKVAASIVAALISIGMFLKTMFELLEMMRR